MSTKTNRGAAPVVPAPHRAAPAPLPATGIVTARLAEALAAGNVLFVASSEQRAETVAAALAAAAPDACILHAPSSDALPGDSAPASPANVGRRVAALHRARRASADGAPAPVALIVTAEGASRLCAPPASFDAAPPHVRPGDVIDAAAFAERLEEIGYLADERVDEPGEVAVRGRVIDIFPADAGLPARIELDEGGTVTAIRAYDPVSQRGTEPLDCLEIGRIAEPAPGKDPATLFDHLPDAAVALDPDAAERRDRFAAMVRDAARGGARPEPVADAARWDAALDGRDRVALDAADAVPRFAEGKAPLRALARFVEAQGDVRFVVAGSARDLRFLRRRLAKALKRDLETAASWAAVHTMPRGALVTLAMPIECGWIEEDLVVVAAADLLGSRAQLDPRGGPGLDALTLQTQDIRPGDVVIHEDFGIGAVVGLEALETSGEDAGDAIVLEYADGARRLVPVTEADRIWRYGADADAVTLDKLDGASWQKRRGTINEAIVESARGLTALAEQRAGRKAPALAPDAAAYERFAAGFPFTETADQARAIAAVRDDLASGTPMDRLVIGDVGYGKTEVALRAAALAALAGQQVIVAAPTTVLVRQHLEDFRRRFAGTGIEVAGLSRLSSAAEKKATKAGLADGSIGIVVGTGAVAAKGVAYANPGLVIVDEEQRFGAADKAKLRALCEHCHILTLTATPIPRTLQTAMVGLQQMSVIATPPARRQPIRTSLGTFDDAMVRTALIRERARGGQSFVVVSRIEDMAPMAERLARLVPELRIAQAHGKMPAPEIDEAMVAFADGPGAGGGDVLLATNIIEAGLDVPRANTMIVWRADRFGLSQLHQLRGRVGRGSRRGQVLLLTEADRPVADATLKRLRTLQAFDRLGAGFAISARDLDMRGAGDLLGDAQAGHMKLIGIDLYQHLLGAALRAARGETVERWTPDLNMGLEGRLPETWIPESEVRIALYCRLARIEEAEALDALEEELDDRFGQAPPEAQRLLGLARLRVLARAISVGRIDAGPAAIALTPRHGFTGDAAAAGLTEKGDRLLLAERIEDAAERLVRTRALLEALAEG